MKRNRFYLKAARCWKNMTIFYNNNPRFASVCKNIMYSSMFILTFALLIGVIYFDIANISNLKTNFNFYSQGIISEYNSNYVGPFFFIGIGKILSLILSIYLIFILSSTVESLYELLSYKLILFKSNYKKYSIESILYKALMWSFYRVFLIFAAPTILGFCIICFTLGSYVFFNQITRIAAASIGMTTFAMTFTTLSLISLFIISIPISVWNFIKSEYGLESIITEPQLNNKKVLSRSSNFIIKNPMNIVFLSLNYIFVGLLLYQFWFLTQNNSIFSYENFIKLRPMIFSNITAWCILRFLKMYLYVDTLKAHYENITFNINENQEFLCELNTENS